MRPTLLRNTAAPFQDVVIDGRCLVRPADPGPRAGRRRPGRRRPARRRRQCARRPGRAACGTSPKAVISLASRSSTAPAGRRSGARVRVTAGGRTRSASLVGGRQLSRRLPSRELCFGLGQATVGRHASRWTGRGGRRKPGPSRALPARGPLRIRAGDADGRVRDRLALVAVCGSRSGGRLTDVEHERRPGPPDTCNAWRSGVGSSRWSGRSRPRASTSGSSASRFRATSRGRRLLRHALRRRRDHADRGRRRLGPRLVGRRVLLVVAVAAAQEHQSEESEATGRAAQPAVCRDGRDAAVRDRPRDDLSCVHDRLSVCNAGHPRPLYYRAADGDLVAAVAGQPTDTTARQLAAGSRRRDAATRRSTSSSGRGDLLVFYTDALTEAADPTGKLLGEAGLAGGRAPARPVRSAPRLRSARPCWRPWRGIGSIGSAEDDVTLVVLHHNASAIATAVAGPEGRRVCQGLRAEDGVIRPRSQRLDRRSGEVSPPTPRSISLDCASSSRRASSSTLVPAATCPALALEPPIMIVRPSSAFGFSRALLGAVRRCADESQIPRPEHPRPDAMRAHWANLNGRWEFRFDAQDQGPARRLGKARRSGLRPTIVVPFPWESELSGIHQIQGRPEGRLVSPPIHRAQRVSRPDSGSGSASGRSTGGPTSGSTAGKSPSTREDTRLSRPTSPTPSSARARNAWSSGPSTRPTRACRRASRSAGTRPARASGRRSGWRRGRRRTSPTSASSPRSIRPGSTFTRRRRRIAASKAKFQRPRRGHVTSSGGRDFHGDEGGHGPGRTQTAFELDTRRPGREALDPRDARPLRRDPRAQGRQRARSSTRSRPTSACARSAAASTATSRSSEFCLNGKPLYLRAALDQSFNPKGLYTAPDDEFLKRDMMIAKTMGLNGLRIHIKPDEPRRLYWADRSAS